MTKSKNFPYLHGFSSEEQDRLRTQAEFAEFTIYQDINFSEVSKLLEIGCGVGAQSEILLRRFPKLELTSVDLNEKQLDAAKAYMKNQPIDPARYSIKKMDAQNLDFESNSFDAAFLCWVLEHVPEPSRVLAEARRVIKPGGKIVITEVMNSSFFLEPYSPNTWKCWMAYNDFQYENAGDPFIGAKLGNLLLASGYRDVKTTVKTWHLDNRHPEKRKEAIEFWTELLMSASQELINAGKITKEMIDDAYQELKKVAKDPNAVYFDSFIQAKGKVY